MKYVAATTAPKPKMTPIAIPAFALPDSALEDDADAVAVEIALALGVGVLPGIVVVLGLPP